MDHSENSVRTSLMSQAVPVYENETPQHTGSGSGRVEVRGGDTGSVGSIQSDALIGVSVGSPPYVTIRKSVQSENSSEASERSTPSSSGQTGEGYGSGQTSEGHGSGQTGELSRYGEEVIEFEDYEGDSQGRGGGTQESLQDSQESDVTSRHSLIEMGESVSEDVSEMNSGTRGSEDSEYSEGFFEDDEDKDNMPWWDKYFLVAQRGSTLATEIRAGLLLFGTMSYILAVNPAVLSAAGFKRLHTAASTAVCGTLATAAFSILVNVPFGAAPGMGLNTLFAYELIKQNSVTPGQALAVSFSSGLAFTVLAMLGWCGYLLNCIPLSLRKAMVVAIGLFQTIIGLYNMDIIVSGQFTVLELGKLSEPPQILSMVTLTMIALFILFDIPSSMLLGLILSVVISVLAGMTPLPTADLTPDVAAAVGQFLTPPTAVIEFPGMDFSIFRSSKGWVSLVFMFTVVFVDTGGVMVGIAAQGEELMDWRTGRVIGDRGCFMVLGIGVMVSAILGTSPMMIFLESAAAVNVGGRTGVTSLVCAICFALSSFFGPALMFVPDAATSAIMVLVGSFMTGAVIAIPWDHINHSLPAYLTIAVTSFTCSVSHGLSAGFAFYMVLNLPFLIAKITKWPFMLSRLAVADDSILRDTPLSRRVALEAKIETTRPSRIEITTSPPPDHDSHLLQGAEGRARAAMGLLLNLSGSTDRVRATAMAVKDGRIEELITDLSSTLNTEYVRLDGSVNSASQRSLLPPSTSAIAALSRPRSVSTSPATGPTLTSPTGTASAGTGTGSNLSSALSPGTLGERKVSSASEVVGVSSASEVMEVGIGQGRSAVRDVRATVGDPRYVRCIGREVMMGRPDMGPDPCDMRGGRGVSGNSANVTESASSTPLCDLMTGSFNDEASYTRSSEASPRERVRRGDGSSRRTTADGTGIGARGTGTDPTIHREPSRQGTSSGRAAGWM
eukprot:GHVN01067854.1.p1 GENE.GHVN01067854.1~~GHVN01067854.1.p1  ORF type:complete len:954 (+),score=198.32 GHVN01067854.1:83-2944(+)